LKENFIFLESLYNVSIFKQVIFLARQKGEEYKCDECGLVVMVENPCDCDDSCVLVCCQEPMKSINPPAKSTATKTSPKSTKKPKK
jgi:hypothetical protein